MKITNWSRGRRVACVALSAALASAMTVGFCPSAQAAAVTADNAVTIAAAKAACCAPEILGISDIEDSWGKKELSWSNFKYMIYGTDYNSNPNPFFVNYLNGVEPGIVFHSRTVSSDGGGAGIAQYGIGDSNDDAIWNRLPDIIMGTRNKALGADIDYDTPEYAGAAAAANGVTDYHPISYSYNLSSYVDFVDSSYKLAKAGLQVVEKSNGTKQLRYGDPIEIAKDYEAYTLGTQGYILSRLEADKAEKKTFVIVKSYDAASGTFTLTSSSDRWGGDNAKKDRYYECMSAVGNDLCDLVGGTTATADQLAQADVIVLSAIAVKSNLPSELLSKCYYTESAAGSSMGLTANSAENSQNMGRLLGCLYPEYVDQDDWIAYFYDNFYHVADGKLADAIDNAMDGIVNWDADMSDRTQWTTADVSTYDEAAVRSKINLGIAYLVANPSELAQLTLQVNPDTGTNYFGYTEKTYAEMTAKSQTIKVSPTSKTYKLATVKKAKQTLSIKVTGAKTTLTAKLDSKASKAKIKATVNSKSKVTITVPKGTKKGTYKITIAAKKSSTYKASAAKTITIKVK